MLCRTDVDMVHRATKEFIVAASALPVVQVFCKLADQCRSRRAVLEVAKKGMRVGFGKKGVRHAVRDGRTSLLNFASEVPSSSVKSYDGLVGIIFVFGPLQVALFDKVFMIVHEVPEKLFPAVVASESNWLVWLMFIDAYASIPCSIRIVLLVE